MARCRCAIFSNFSENDATASRDGSITSTPIASPSTRRRPMHLRGSVLPNEKVVAGGRRKTPAGRPRRVEVSELAPFGQRRHQAKTHRYGAGRRDLDGGDDGAVGQLRPVQRRRQFAAKPPRHVAVDADAKRPTRRRRRDFGVFQRRQLDGQRDARDGVVKPGAYQLRRSPAGRTDGARNADARAICPSRRRRERGCEQESRGQRHKWAARQWRNLQVRATHRRSHRRRRTSRPERSRRSTRRGCSERWIRVAVPAPQPND